MAPQSPSYALSRSLWRALLPLLLGTIVFGANARAAQFTLQWSDNSSNESGFRIERSADGTSFEEIATVGANVVSYVDSGLPGSTKYSYRIRAFNSAGDSAYSNIAVGTTPPLASNQAPTISGIGDRSVYAGTLTGAIPFLVADAESAANALSVTVNSSNTSLVPVSAITLGGTGSVRTVSVTPAPARTGTATISITVSDGTLAATSSFAVAVHAAGTGALITSQPQPATVAPGSPLILNVGVQAVGTATYQWYRDGVVIAGATGATYRVPVAQRSDAGNYHAAVTVGDVTITSNTVTVAAGSVPSTGVLANLSCRASVVNGEGLLIPGFVVSGAGTKRILLRMVGPGLGIFGLNGLLADPHLTLKRLTSSGFADVASNKNWADGGSTAMRQMFSAVGAFDLSDGSGDAALVVDAPAGVYTVMAADEQPGRTGISIVEVYDAANSGDTARLTNLSTRGFLGTGNHAMIAGFVIEDGPVTLLLRTVGPGLAPLGVNAPAVNPRMDLMRRVDGADELVASNDDWGSNPDAAHTAQVSQQVSAFALTEGSRDAAMVVTLPPGIYTVISQGVGATTGIALVEMYVVP